MVEDDVTYIRSLISAGVVQSPCLEAGAGLEGHNLKQFLNDAGVSWSGTDLQAREAGFYAVDLGDDFARIDAVFGGKRFRTLLLLNVIEHVFEPIKVMDNACKLISPGGHLVVIVPSVWPLHYFPLDCWRIPPNFFEEYAARRGVELLLPHFLYVTPGNQPICRDLAGKPEYPKPSSDRRRYWKSRIVHRLFDTFGRTMSTASHVSTGAVFRV